MNKLKEFYSSFGFIITFMFLSVLISALFGQKFLNKFLILILASQLILNSDEAVTLINKFNLSNDKVNNQNNNNNKIENKFSGDVINGKIVTKYLDENNKIVTEYIQKENDGKLDTPLLDKIANKKFETKYIY